MGLTEGQLLRHGVGSPRGRAYEAGREKTGLSPQKQNRSQCALGWSLQYWYIPF